MIGCSFFYIYSAEGLLSFLDFPFLYLFCSHFSSYSFKVQVCQFLPFHNLSLFLLIDFFFLGMSHIFLWMTDNFLSDPQHCEFYFLKCSVCCVPLKSAGLCSVCSYLHMSLILSRSAFFFSKEFKCLLRVKYKHRPIDLQKNRVFGELFVPGLQLYAPVTIYWGAGSFTARIGDWKGHLMILTGKW